MNFISSSIFISIIFAQSIFAEDYAKSLDNFLRRLNPPSLRDPEQDMTVPEAIQYHGYPVETHDITTADGYILTVHRIPYGKNIYDWSYRRQPVLIQHGILADSGCWIANTADKNLPYYLADRRYDVWLGNFRGNSFGRRHINMTGNDEKFWKFSFDEMAQYDIPAMTEFILNKTGFNRIQYIGHSMGTTAMLILLSTNAKYNEKISVFHALAPVARLDYVKSPLILLGIPFEEEMKEFMDSVGGGELLPNSSLIDVVADSLCTWSTRAVCSNVVFLFSGFDQVLFNETRLPVILHFFPTGTSTQTLHHYAQIAAQHRFQAHDYGEDENMIRYNKPFPPAYNVSKITAPTALYWSDSDWIASPKDVEYLITKMNKTLVLNYHVPFPRFNHIDFEWGTRAIPLVYRKLYKTMEKFREKEE